MESVIGFGGLGGVSEGLKMVGVVEKSLGMIIRVKERPLATERAVIVVVDFASGKKRKTGVMHHVMLCIDSSLALEYC